ncbi:nucleotidyltransferase domain-containing protein [Brenneria goodwinii]|uniref:Polymerase nucleotidyl transferase domain-containing protein n=2 Tax=Brenneria goodwinii TaxID=1109412 RepID=A0A0G4JWX8_9GAMM|nr:nucleotidyltransferase domain-containing protein [Brenneria goodwinii]CPR17938.1 hypothetical protein BN1221_02931c [Brenneria goodwinii]
MTLDAEGYINISPPVRLQSPFQEVVDEVTNHLTLRLGHLLHSVYLYGSVAQGKAVAGVSDLDVCILLTRRANNIETHTLSDIRKKIALNHPIVCKIDFDVGILSEALNPDNLYSWGYWLKHHCRCIYGEDLSKRFDRFKPSKAIAIAVNGDFIAVLEEYIRRLAEAGDDHQRKQLQRAASRKLIRSTNLLRSDEDTDWPDTLDEYVSRFVKKYPSQENEIRYFLRESDAPEDEAKKFTANLKTFMGWLTEASGHHR